MLAAGIAAGVVGLAGFVPYIYSTIKGKTRPNRATWWIWAVLALIIATSYHSVGAGDTIWVTISFFIGPLAIALLSIKHGEGGWNRFDGACLVGAGIGIALWVVFNAPLAALLLTIAIDGLGLLPTIRKSIIRPESEDRLSWTLFFSASVLNLVALDSWAFELAVYPVYIFLLEGTMMYLLWRPRAQ